jgi:hypothetical protein
MLSGRSPRTNSEIRNSGSLAGGPTAALNLLFGAAIANLADLRVLWHAISALAPAAFSVRTVRGRRLARQVQQAFARCKIEALSIPR